MSSDLRTTYMKDRCCTEFLCVIRNVSVHMDLAEHQGSVQQEFAWGEQHVPDLPVGQEDYFPSVGRRGCVTAQCRTKEKLMQEVCMGSQDM